MNESERRDGPPVALQASVGPAKTFQRPAGHRCRVSSTIMETLSFGNGELDRNGFWEHGCYDCARAHEAQFPEDGICWPHSEETLAEWKKKEEANQKREERAL